MAANFHDPNNHAPAVSPADVWDDAGLPPRACGGGGVLLPNKRLRAVRGPAAGASCEPVPTGLRIDVKCAERKASSTPGAAAIQEYGAAVVKLEQAVAEGPFQAARVIPAMELSEREEVSELQGEGKDWGKVRHLPLRWLVAAGVGVGGVLVAALATQELLLAPKSKARAGSLEWVEESKFDEIKGFELDGSSETDARKLLATYAKATAPEHVLPLIRDAARLTSRLRQDWRPWQVPADWQPARNAEWQTGTEGGRSHGLLSGRKPDYTSYRVYFVREGDALRIDWEATDGLGDSEFAALGRGVGSGGLLRAYLAPENFYSLTFPESTYRSYKLLAPDREQVVWGYVELGSPAAAALLKIFESAEAAGEPPAERPMTLRLTNPPKGAQKNQWVIGELLHIDWVCP